MDARISLITLGVADLPRAIAFYEALGWPRRFASAEGVAFFQLGPIGLSLFPTGDLAADAGVARDGTGFRRITLAHNVATREGVDTAIDAMVAAGGAVTKPAEEKDWGGYGGYVADPDGHLWEIAWNPHFPLDEEGGLTIPA